jgi:hypothetical protein
MYLIPRTWVIPFAFCRQLFAANMYLHTTSNHHLLSSIVAPSVSIVAPSIIFIIVASSSTINRRHQQSSTLPLAGLTDTLHGSRIHAFNCWRQQLRQEWAVRFLAQEQMEWNPLSFCWEIIWSPQCLEEVVPLLSLWQILSNKMRKAQCESIYFGAYTRQRKGKTSSCLLSTTYHLFSSLNPH